MRKSIEDIFPVTIRCLGTDVPETLQDLYAQADEVAFMDGLVRCVEVHACAPFVSDVAAAEKARDIVGLVEIDTAAERERYELNPSLEIMGTAWDILSVLNGQVDEPVMFAEQRWVLLFKHPRHKKVQSMYADAKDLLGIKIAANGIDLDQAAEEGKTTTTALDVIMKRGVKCGFLLGPASKIRRDRRLHKADIVTRKDVWQVETFTLQWHITNACDLHCKHCYDRVRPSPMTREQGQDILQSFQVFCQEHNVRGHVCFSGGNPFFSPHFFDLYRETAGMGFSTSVLGNPVSRAELESLVAIQKPGYFQVSLEGLEGHNDCIRGEGFYERVMVFLDLLRDMKVSSAVMLTLTRDNIAEVIPLAQVLQGKADHFTFNRLAQVGEGANLFLPETDEYSAFLREYINASKQYPVMGFKDNLINILLDKCGSRLFGGCTGYGCGAAFNFVAVLPDGEVHACRKFPSLIGHAFEQSIADIYESPVAERYRQGCSACNECRIRAVCGGCMAVVQGMGKDPFTDKDPFCFCACMKDA